MTDRSTVVLVSRVGLGHVKAEDQSFGLEMFDKFVHALERSATRPSAICFYTEGVRLACQGSPALMGLSLLEGSGVRLVVCGTCLNYFGLTDQVAVGEVGGMDEIAGLLLGAHHVISV